MSESRGASVSIVTIGDLTGAAALQPTDSFALCQNPNGCTATDPLYSASIQQVADYLLPLITFQGGTVPNYTVFNAGIRIVDGGLQVQAGGFSSDYISRFVAPDVGDNSNQVPTTSWVNAAITAAGGGGGSVPDPLTLIHGLTLDGSAQGIRYSALGTDGANHQTAMVWDGFGFHAYVDATDTGVLANQAWTQASFLNIGGGSLTGDLTVTGNLHVTGATTLAGASAATAAAGDNSTIVATTAFVTQAISSYVPLAGGVMSGGLAIGGVADMGPGTINVASGYYVNGVLPSYISSVIDYNNRIQGIPNGAPVDITHVDLEPGRYIISGEVWLVVDSGTPLVQRTVGALSPNSAAIPTGPADDSSVTADEIDQPKQAGGVSTGVVMPLAALHVNMTAAGSYYLCARMEWDNAAVVSAYGKISAVQIS